MLPPTTTPTTTTLTVLGPDGFAEGKTAKNAKSWKFTKSVFCDFWQRYRSQRAEILHSTLCHQYLHFCFYKFFCILHRSDNTKVEPTRTTRTTIPRSGLRHGKKRARGLCIRTRKFEFLRVEPGSCPVFLSTDLWAVCPDFFVKMRKILLKMREKMRQPKILTFYCIFGRFWVGLLFVSFDLFFLKKIN